MLKVAIIQYNIAWEAPQANQSKLDAWIRKVDPSADIIVLPEMFSTGFTMAPSTWAHTDGSDWVQWLQGLAQEKDACIIGSLSVNENGKFYNRLFAVGPRGILAQYDKRHLFQMAGEHLVYTPGADRVVFQWKGCRIAPFICYDLRFPVWCRNTEQVDVMLFVANWPAVRIGAWDVLLRARAIENLCYVIGVNRVGADGNGIEHNGRSAVIDSKGNYVLGPVEKEDIFEASLDLNELQLFREKFPAHQDADDFEIRGIQTL